MVSLCDLRQPRSFPERVHSSTKFVELDRFSKRARRGDKAMGKGEGGSPQAENLRVASAVENRIVLKKRPGAARNPAPCVYDPTGATSLKTRYAQQFHRSAAAPFSLHCRTLRSKAQCPALRRLRREKDSPESI